MVLFQTPKRRLLSLTSLLLIRTWVA